MGGVLSGLGRFGLDSLEGMDLYGKPKQEEKEKKVEEKKAAPVVQDRICCLIRHIGVLSAIKNSNQGR